MQSTRRTLCDACVRARERSDLKHPASMSKAADSSLRCYVRLILQMQMCKELRRWESKAALQQRMPGFRIQVGVLCRSNSLPSRCGGEVVIDLDGELSIAGDEREVR